MIKTFLIKFKGKILDIFFPIRCLGCKKFDHWICNDCHSALPILSEQHCFICKKIETVNGKLCTNCLSKLKEKPALDSVFIVSTYQDKLLKKTIHKFKYNFIKDVAEPLTLLTAQSLQNSNFPIPDFIIPVPIHKKRLRWRGFNQSLILAKKLDLKIPILNNILTKKIHTKPQAKTKSRQERIKNLNDAFSIKKSEKIKGKKILLIDDIITTGTTLEQCAKLLKSAGAKKVYALVLARE